MSQEPFDHETGEIIPNGATRAGATHPRAPGAEIGSIQASAQAAAMATMKLRSELAAARPRNMEAVRTALLEECKRESFAEIAFYEVERGRDKITGPSIRFAEAAVRCLGNLSITDAMIHDDNDKRVIRVSVFDFDTNIDYGTEVVLSKTTERSSPHGRNVIAQRVGSNNQLVYICAATEEEVQQKKAQAVSKTVRNAVLRMLPASIMEDAVVRVRRTLREAAMKRDPKVVAEKIIDQFGSLGVSVPQIEAFLGVKNIAAGISSPEAIDKARAAYALVRAGEATVSGLFRTAAPAPSAGKLAAKMGVAEEPRSEPEPESDATADF